MVKSTCRGSGFLNRAINALPFELHIPGYQFCGPGTKLAKRLARGDKGINPLDTACREHDIAYSHSNELSDRHAADKILASKARERIIAKDSTLGERAAATTVWAAMNVKRKVGMGIKKRNLNKQKKKKRILPTAKRGGFLPILPLLGVLGSLVGGAAGVAKAVNDRKDAKRRLDELERHHRALEVFGAENQSIAFTACKEFFASTLQNPIPEDIWNEMKPKFLPVAQGVNLLEASMIAITDAPLLLQCIERCSHLFKQEELNAWTPLINAETPEWTSNFLKLFATSTNLQGRTVLSIYFLVRAHLISNPHRAFIGPIFMFVFALSKSATAGMAWDKRADIVERVFDGWSRPVAGLIEYDIEAARMMADTILFLAKNEGLDINVVCSVLSRMTAQYDNVIPNLSAMVQQTEWKFMTIPMTIREAVTSFKEVGWMTMLKKVPRLREEFEFFIKYFELTKVNPFVGFVSEGIAAKIPNLAYFCVRLSIELGGNKSLSDYGGIGGDKNATLVPLKRISESLFYIYN